MTEPKYPKIGRKESLPFGAKRWLLGDEQARSRVEVRWELDVGELWDECGQAVVNHWVRRHPGTRPKWWWDHREPRQRLGGTGTPLHECSAYAATYRFGLPLFWKRRGEAYLPRCTAIDPSDLPQFESEAAYLKRHRLLLPGEARRLRPRDFVDEAVVWPAPPAFVSIASG
jgi:hypothetical protein